MPQPGVPPLTADQIVQLDSAVALWAERHPLPDYPAFAFAGTRPFSPRQLAAALHAREGEIAENFLLMTRFAMEVQNFEAIVTAFSTSSGEPGPEVSTS